MILNSRLLLMVLVHTFLIQLKLTLNVVVLTLKTFVNILWWLIINREIPPERTFLRRLSPEAAVVLALLTSRVKSVRLMFRLLRWFWL